MRGGFVLRERDSTLGLDRLESAHSIRPGAREHDTDRLPSLVGGERSEKLVDREIGRRMRPPRREPEHAIVNAHRGAFGHHVHASRLDPHAIRRLDDAERGDLREQFRKQALVPGVQMLEQHEAHLRARR